MTFLLITRQKDDDKKYFSLFFRLWPLKYFHTERPSASIWLSQHISWSKHTQKRNFYVKANHATFHRPKVGFEERTLSERISVFWNMYFVKMKDLKMLFSEKLWKFREIASYVLGKTLKVRKENSWMLCQFLKVAVFSWNCVKSNWFFVNFSSN